MIPPLLRLLWQPRAGHLSLRLLRRYRSPQAITALPGKDLADPHLRSGCAGGCHRTASAAACRGPGPGHRRPVSGTAARGDGCPVAGHRGSGPVAHRHCWAGRLVLAVRGVGAGRTGPHTGRLARDERGDAPSRAGGVHIVPGHPGTGGAVRGAAAPARRRCPRGHRRTAHRPAHRLADHLLRAEATRHRPGEHVGAHVRRPSTAVPAGFASRSGGQAPPPPRHLSGADAPIPHGRMRVRRVSDSCRARRSFA